MGNEKRFPVFIYRDAQIVRLAFRYGIQNWEAQEQLWGEGLLTGESSATFPFQAANIFICFADLCVLCAPCFVFLCGSKFLMNLHVVFGVWQEGV